MFYRIIEKLNNSKKHPYYYISPLAYAIGNACEQIIISSIKIKNKKIIILFPYFFKNFFKYDLCNNYLFKNLKINNFSNQKSLLKTFINFFLNIEFFFRKIKFRFLSKIFNLNKSEYDSFPHVGIHVIYEKNFLKKNFNDIEHINFSNLEVSLEEEKKIFCKKILNKEKIPLNNLVCLHVRDGGFKNDHQRKSYRNSNINNYIDMIKYLIDNGYFVVRMGNSSASKIDFSNRNYFNYSHSNINSGLMDLFFISECNFFVGNQSGIMETAYMFNKPTLTVNMCEMFCSYPRKINDRGLFKKMKLKDQQTQLNLLDYIKMDYSKHNPENEVFDFTFFENSSQELYDSIVEFERLQVSKNFELSLNQKKINTILKERFKNSLYNEIINTNDTFHKLENSKAGFWMKSIKGSLCESYLKNVF